jgi:uncharacterized protein GlcG (DUF336 family)
MIGGGVNRYLGFRNLDTVVNAQPGDVDLRTDNAPPNLSATLGLVPSGAEDPGAQLTPDEVQQLLARAAASNANQTAIIAVVDRGGRILGVRVEGGVSPAITGNTQNLVFAIDGAVAEARTGALFGNDQAPLTSRTIGFISQTTITQREVESDPSIQDPNSPLRGPGFVAPIRIGGHFPPGVSYTPQVDLFEIEGTNRDTTFHVGPSGIVGAPDSVRLPERFNVTPADIPGTIPLNQQLEPMDSYGFVSGLEPNAAPRGIGTLPGGIPIYKTDPETGRLLEVGGIGVFFPGTTGFADEENSRLSSNFDPTKPDLSLQAEYMAFAALGGLPPLGLGIGTLGGVAPVPGVGLPNIPPNRIDLVGITLDTIGPGGTQGPQNLFTFGATLGQGNPNSGFNASLRLPVNNTFGGATVNDPGTNPPAGNNNTLAGTPVPEGWLVTPHAGTTLTAAEVQQIIEQGVKQAIETRAAIRLPLDSITSMVFAVADPVTGEILGLFRMPDATTFSIDVAVAKARNNAYYANPAQLQPQDQLPGIPPGVAFSSRTFRYLAEPFFPEGIDGTQPGAPFSILHDGNVSFSTALNLGAPLPASAYVSILGHDAFNPQTNFHDPFNILNQNGIVFFPGGVPLYQGSVLAGGLGVSGDGVDQDDVVTFSAKANFGQPPSILQIDQLLFDGVRLPYQEFNRQPLEDPVPGGAVVVANQSP